MSKNTHAVFIEKISINKELNIFSKSLEEKVYNICQQYNIILIIDHSFINSHFDNKKISTNKILIRRSYQEYLGNIFYVSGNHDITNRERNIEHICSSMLLKFYVFNVFLSGLIC